MTRTGTRSARATAELADGAQDWASPYYNASHRKLRKFMRELVEEEVIPNITEWEADKKRA